MFGDKELTAKDTDEVVELLANLFRHDSYFLRLSNSTDAYEFYKKEFRDSYETVLKQGLSYKNKDTYIICINLTKLRKEDPTSFEGMFGEVPAFIDYVSREQKDVIYIFSIFSRKKIGYCSEVEKVLKDFIKRNSDKAIYCDGFAREDFLEISAKTGCREIQISNLPYLVWR